MINRESEDKRPKSDTPWRRAWAIVRVDLFLFRDNEEIKNLDWDSRIKVKEIVLSRNCAEVEVARLNNLHPDGDVRYFWQLTRIYDER